MITTMLLCLCGVLGQAEFAARVDLMAFHVERLEVITVPAELEADKAARIAGVKEKIAAGADSEAAFNAIYYAIDDVRQWLWENAAERPQTAPAKFQDTGSHWIVATPQLTFSINQKTLGMEVVAQGHAWTFADCGKNDLAYAGQALSLRDAKTRRAEALHPGYGAGMSVSLSEFPKAPGLTLILNVEIIGTEIVFEAVARENGTGFERLYWPQCLPLKNTADTASVIPYMQGMLLPGDWPQSFKKEELVHSRTLYMPWWGQLDGTHGMTVILETTDDAGARFRHDEGGPTRIELWWQDSLGRMAYPRRVRYCFSENASYISMAKRYRRFVQEKGEFVSLAEKAVRTPNVNEVIGRPVLHVGALYHFVKETRSFNKDRIEANHGLTTFEKLIDTMKMSKENGLEDAYVHLDGWGYYGYDNGHPDVLPVGGEQGGWEGMKAFADTCDELGYLLATHDQYRDFYLNAASYDDKLTLTDAKGKHEIHADWCGGPQTILSPRFAPGYVRRNHDLFAEHGIKVKGAYLDVFAVVPLEQSHQPRHPVTRRECAAYRRECFDLLRARGYVVSSEEPADYLVRSLDLVHHAPYATYPNLGGGGPSGILVPLFSLVYHDSILIPWDLGPNGSWGVPKGDSGKLHCALNAGLPYAFPGQSGDAIKELNTLSALNTHCVHLEMTNHEFLNDTHRQQRTTYSDGTQVTVDFDAGTYAVEMGGK